MRLLILADTHIPRRARDLPTELWEWVDRSDVVIHAGDWCDLASLQRLRGRSAALVGVHGNNDSPDLRARLPEVAHVTLAGVRVSVAHETGAAKGRERRCARRFGDSDVLVFGHSHIPWDSTTEHGLRLLNPGSPTDRRRQPHHTYMTAVIADAQLREVRLHRLGATG